MGSTVQLVVMVLLLQARMHGILGSPWTMQLAENKAWSEYAAEIKLPIVDRYEMPRNKGSHAQQQRSVRAAGEISWSGQRIWEQVIGLVDEAGPCS
jgi:hypothetical protein